jgi:hypothetical protein
MGDCMDVFTPASLSVLKRKLDLSKIKSLRARVFFKDFKQLQSSLEQIALIDQQKNFIKGLVQVVYQPEQIEYIYHELHFNFMKKCAKISSYVPLCSPIFDQNITKWATPTHCTSCIFFEGNRCEGLGNTENFIHNVKQGDTISLSILKDEFAKKITKEKELNFYDKSVNYGIISVFGVSDKNQNYLNIYNYNNELTSDKPYGIWMFGLLGLFLIGTATYLLRLKESQPLTACKR